MGLKNLNRRKFIQLGGVTALSFTTKGILPSLKPDVLIIGAGATGCNAAWHLNKLGHSVTVIEASGGPAKQASQAAAGFVANWSGLHNRTWGKTQHEMQKYGIDFYTHLGGRSKKDIGFKKCGISYIYTKPAEWNVALNVMEKTRSLGIPFEILTKHRSSELLPVLEFDEVSGIVYDPSSVRVRAADTIPFLAAEAADKGVKFIFNTKVLSFVKSGSRVTGVKTDKGNFEAGNVLITAGAWSLRFLDEIGVQPPVVPRIEARYTSQAMPEIPANLPLLIFADIGFYIREEHGGLLIGGGDKSSEPDRQVDFRNPPTSDKLTNHPQIGRIKKHVSDIYNIIPVLSKADIKEIRGGVPTFTKDVNFIADRVESTANLYVVTACQEAGITHGPALGKMMANFISTGIASPELNDFKLNRF